MTALDVLSLVKEKYHILPDYPFKKDRAAVFRHPKSRKWFGIIMEVPLSKLGLLGEDYVNVLNVKCDPLLIGSLRKETGFHPAYHMNKDKWLSIRLDGSADREIVISLIDMSFSLTKDAKDSQS